jgi:hypothetical protein
MALKRRRILKQMLDMGHGTATVPADSGGELTGDLIGIHTFLGGGYVSTTAFPGNLGERISAAIDALPSGGGVVDARGEEGAQTISAAIDIGTRKVLILLGATTITASTSLFTFSSGGSLWLEGLNRETTTINYNQASGTVIDFSDVHYCGIRNLSLYATSSGNTAVGVYLYRSQHHTYENVTVSAFSTNFRLAATNSELTRTFNVRFINVFSNSFLAAGFHLTHSVDIYFTNVQAWITNGNPTAGYALIIDTGVSGVQINAMSVIGGGVIIRHTLATSATFDMPPEYIFVNQMTVDTVTGMPCIELDSTLAVVDPGTRLGKSYRFEQCWASFTQTTDMPGILIAGGENVSFIQTLVRLNKYHGIHVTGGNNIRLIESAVLGNNQQNAADGDGIRIAANLINFQIIGGVSGNDIAGETGNQEYGIRIETGTSDEYIISNVDVSTGNDTGGIFDGGAGANKVVSNIIGSQDNGAGNIIAYYERKYGATGRIELGDGKSRLQRLRTIRPFRQYQVPRDWWSNHHTGCGWRTWHFRWDRCLCGLNGDLDHEGTPPAAHDIHTAGRH